MSDQTDNLLNLVKPYGLSDDEGKLYLLLLKSGFQTALTISRELHMGRTKVYRLLDKLRDKSLVEFRVGDRGMSFGATSPHKFQQLVSSREKQLAALKANLPTLTTSLFALLGQGFNQQQSKVLCYEGLAGLKQVSYNITKAKDTVRVFEMEHLSDFLPWDFSEEVRQKLVDNKITTLDLTNKSSFGAFTDVKDMIAQYSQFRHIKPSLLKINFEVLIYNDVYATYSYKDQSIFCVEIYNKQLADMQKQIFDYIWQQAEPMMFVNDRGAARLIRNNIKR